MVYYAKLIFEAEITEVGKKFFRFERTNYESGFFSEKFGKLFHETADLKDFHPKQKILVQISNVTPSDVLLVQKRNKLIVRGVVNEKAPFGMSLRKPYPVKTTFFERAFKTFEFAEITESTVLNSEKNPYEVGDFIQLIVEVLPENPPSPILGLPKQSTKTGRRWQSKKYFHRKS
ncbi:MAG: hypothetical protein HY376_03100 [Candidatus Blackburnbacteria bacterium]|nr:hypothetical protein [Candidatus Blackburnbacteria bacterium]